MCICEWDDLRPPTASNRHASRSHAAADRLDDLIAMRGREDERSLGEHIALHFAKHRQQERGRINEFVVGPLMETRKRMS